MLTPWLRPVNLNGGITGSAALANALLVSNKYLPLDKNDKTSVAANIARFRNLAGNVLEATSAITNLAGIRSPYYVIGEIKKTLDTQYDQNIFGTAMRAVQSAFNAPEQKGVIIDCLGDVNAEISVEFTGQPIYYMSSDIINSRVRKPTVVRAVVAVSNYMSDDVIGAAASTLEQVAGPLGTMIKNTIMYGGNTRAQKALYDLRNLQETGVPFRVYTPHGYYDNMLIQSLRPKTDATSMDMLLCEIEFKEAIMAAPYLSESELAKRNLKRSNVTEASGTLADKIRSMREDIAKENAKKGKKE